MRHGVFGITAAGDERADLIAFAPRCHIRADVRDLAGHFHAKRLRCTGRRRIAAFGLVHIGVIKSRRAYLNENLSRFGFGLGNVRHYEAVFLPRILDSNRFHPVSRLARIIFQADTSSAKSERETMPIDPEELLPRKKTQEIVLGQDLSAISEHELTARIAVLEEEIARSREAIKSRQTSRSAADAVFRKN
jgi:uncharacterized small protein (DUF1192 family)